MLGAVRRILPPMRFAVLDTEDTEKWAGHAALHIMTYARADCNDTWLCYRCCERELPDKATAETLDGVVITGSHYDAREETLWLAELADWLRAVAHLGRIRILGGCFGHQIMARALGGVVASNPSGRFFLGAEVVQPLAAFSEHHAFRAAMALFPDRGGALQLLQSHGQHVEALPPGATPLLCSASAPYEAWAWGDSVLAWQGHPEFTAELLDAKIITPREKRGATSTEEADEARGASFAGAVEPDRAFVVAAGRAFLHVGRPPDTVADVAAALEAARAAYPVEPVSHDAA